MSREEEEQGVVQAGRQSAARSRWRVLAIPAVAGLLIGFLWLVMSLDTSNSETLRYRLTYEVDVDGEMRSGTGVVQIRVVEQNNVFSPSYIGFQVTGEAVVVDLGNGDYLFSLLAGKIAEVSGWGSHATTPDKLIMLAFRGQSNSIPNSYRMLMETKPSVDLPFELLPVLATLEDINDPTSLRLVDPDDLAAHFGANVSLERATIEITSDPVTRGQVAEYFVWPRGWDQSLETPEFRFYSFHFEK